MKKRLQTWLASIIREELERVEKSLKLHVADAVAGLKTDTEKIFQRSVRMPCRFCGQMTYKHVVDESSGKTKCLDCVAKGL